MSNRTANITLDGRLYKVHALNMKELREVMTIISKRANGGSDDVGSGIEILQIGLRRCEPPVENFEDIEPTIPELGEATATILKLAGLEAPNPQAAAPAQ